MFLSLLFVLGFFTKTATLTPVVQPVQQLGQAEFSLTDRYWNTYVNTVFSDNILLTLAYMRGIIKHNTVDWGAVKKPFTYSFTLQPGQVFAFHDGFLPQFQGKVVKTTNATLDSTQGFESDGYLVGDGVCHLASLINEAARNAGLTVVAPVNHDFAKIPEVDRKYGTAIYYMPGETTANAMQNLYVQNNKDKPVTITFTYKNKELTVSLYEEKTM